MTGQQVQGENSGRAIGGKLGGVVRTSCHEREFRVDDQNLPLVVNDHASDVRAQNLSDDISVSILILTFKDRVLTGNAPQSLPFRETLENNVGQSDTRVEVTARCRTAGSKCEENTEGISKTDLQDRCLQKKEEKNLSNMDGALSFHNTYKTVVLSKWYQPRSLPLIRFLEPSVSIGQR